MKIGVIGSGKIVSWFLNDIENNKYKDDIKVTALHSNNEKTGTEYIKKYNIDKFIGDFNEFIKEDFDLVYVGTTDIVHVELSTKLLNAGHNVYCEKPISFNYEEAQGLYKLAKEKNKLFFDGIKTGFSPAYKSMKEEINKGIIGDIILIHTTHTKVSTSLVKPNPSADRVTSGFHLGGGVYSAFVAIDLGGFIQDFSYRANAYENNPAVATSAILARHESGVISTIVGSDYTTDNLTGVIQGTKGYITLGGNLDKYNESYKKDSEHMAHTYEVRDLANNLISKFDDEFISEGEGLVFVLEHVYEILKAGKTESDIVSPEKSLAISKLLDSTNKKN